MNVRRSSSSAWNRASMASVADMRPPRIETISGFEVRGRRFARSGGNKGHSPEGLLDYVARML